jgi:glutamine synthetase
MAPIFKDANAAADNNQIVMTVLRNVALKHDFVCLLHEKPFAGVNGSGKHLNWSMSTDTGVNLLEPGNDPHENYRFLAVVATVTEAVYRHADVIRMGIASHANDHRLGANEAPPSIMSVFLGDTLTKILDSMVSGGKYVHSARQVLDLGARQLADLMKDNTDRNRTSPFAFTGNKFEFRACGSSASIGYPLSILNAAVADIFEETNKLLEDEIAKGKTPDDALMAVVLKWYGNAQKVVFNGDGYSQDWVKEAEKRGLGNMRTTPEAIAVLKDGKKTNFLVQTGVFREGEISTRHNVMLERYIKCRQIELKTLSAMIHQQVLPAAVQYKAQLSESVKRLKDISGADSSLEVDLLRDLSDLSKTLYDETRSLIHSLDELHHKGDEEMMAKKIASDLMPRSFKLADVCNQIEEIVPDSMWPVPKFYDMLFIR